MMNTVLGLLAKGDMNCAGDEITDDLFRSPDVRPTITTADLHNNPRPIIETTGKGVVLTEAEKQKVEEEAYNRRLREEEEERIAEQEEKERLEKERKNRENSFWHKMVKGAKDFGKKMIQEDE